MRANANSKNPRVTLILFIHEPPRLVFFKRVGKRAKRVKGSANAMAKPSIPMVGASTPPPEVLTPTRRNPMMGPVQEKLTKAKVNAMRKILSKPVVLEALESMALFHLEGRVISNPPKNEAPKATSMAKKRRLKMALVERSFKAEAPKMEVTMTPRAT